jgi:hypothetical protein
MTKFQAYAGIKIRRFLQWSEGDSIQVKITIRVFSPVVGQISTPDDHCRFGFSLFENFHFSAIKRCRTTARKQRAINPTALAIIWQHS